MDIDSDRLVVGAPYMDPAGGAPGQAYVFERTGETWTEVAVLTPSVSSNEDAFGIDVAIAGDVIVVGAFYRGSAPGKAFVFRWSGTDWIEESELFAPGHTAFDGFGFSVDVAGASIAVGAYDDGSSQTAAGGGTAPGAVYIYEWDGNVWSSHGTLLGDQVGYADSFGQDVSMGTEFLIVGARTDSSITPTAGAAYLFRRVGSSWQFHEKLTRTNGAAQDWFGVGVAIHKSKLLIANFKSSVFLYSYDGLLWNAVPHLLGGSAVAVSGSYGLASSGYVYALDAIPPCIPATSAWTLAALCLLLLTMATARVRAVGRNTALFLVIMFSSAMVSDAAPLDAPHRSDRLLVRFRAETSISVQNTSLENAGAELLTRDPHVQGLSILHVAPNGLTNAFEKLASDANVLYVEPDYLIEPTISPNDPNYSFQWGMANARLPLAWDIWTGELDPNCRIAVIDSGVDYDHPDLMGNIWTNSGEIPGNSVDDDGNGWVDDIHGYDFGEGDSDPMPTNSAHGTHIAGIIGAYANNSLGVAGVNWRCKIVALKIWNSGGTISVSSAIQAMTYVIANDILVSNSSWKLTGGFSQSLYDKIQASQAIGHIFVTAAGNQGVDTDISPIYPGCYDLANIINVASIQNGDNLVASSNFGLVSVDLAEGETPLSALGGSPTR